jgi:hypothetical protein
MTPPPAGVFYVVLAFLLTCLFFVAPLQLSARTSQSIPRQIEEETHREENHESRVKAPKLVTSWRRATRRAPFKTAASDRHQATSALKGRRPDIAECWDAHSHRRRGPPALLSLS